MAASRAQMCKLRLTKNIQLTIRLRQARNIFVFSASLGSCAGVFSKNNECYRGGFLHGFCVDSSCRTWSTRKSGHRLLERIYQLQSHKNCQIFSSRCITTSALYLNGKDSISTGKRKLKEMRESILTIPNVLSSFRIVAAPFLGYFIISEEFTVAAALFVVAGITDMLDGYIARNFKNQKSVFGTILDPVADKILMSVLTISLTAADLLPIPLTVLILSRDALLIAAAFYFRYKSLPSPITISRYFDVNLATVELRPNILGKANTVLQLGLVGSTLLAPIVGYVDHPYLQAMWSLKYLGAQPFITLYIKNNILYERYIVGMSTVLSSVSYLFSTSTSVRYLK